MEWELELELEWELELKGGAERWSWSWIWSWIWHLELKPEKCRELQPGPPKSDFGSKMAFRLRFTIEIVLLGPFLEPLSKPENVLFAPGDRL